MTSNFQNCYFHKYHIIFTLFFFSFVSEILQPSESAGESVLTLSSTQTKVGTHVRRQRHTRQRLTVPQGPIYSFSADRTSLDDIPFTRNPGLNQSPTVKQPIEYFNMLFTAELKTLIVNETNDFAETKKSGASIHARIRRWKTLTIEEFTMWLGLLIHMGNMVLPRISDYWTTDKLFNLPFVRSVMSRDRFMNILNCLHFHNNRPPQTETDRLYKIRPLIKFFHEIMEKLVTPTRRLCIDESMILWRGRLVFRVYLKGKRHKYGIKLYMLTEPSGLVLRFIVYSGSGDQEVGGQGHVDMVVHKLMEGQLDFGHSLFMDNYYNSVRLAHELLERKTYVTGTLRKNRKNNPPQVVSKKLKKSETTSLFSDSGICVLKWNDRREVLMISSEFSPDLVDVTDRRGRVVQKPEMVAEYNKSMGGIDHMDQLLAYYPIERKCMKWYRKVAIHIFHLILTNSYILFRRDNPSSKMSLYDFRLNLVKSLTAPAFPSPSAPSNIPPVPSNPLFVPSPGPSSQTTTVLHAPRQRPLNDKNKRLFRRCVVCLKSGKRKESSYYCPDCPKEPHLCAPCFREYHEQ